MKAIMGFVKPICIAIILEVVVTLSRENYTIAGKVRPASVGIGLLMLYLLVKRKWPVPRVLASAAALGVLCYGVIPALLPA